MVIAYRRRERGGEGMGKARVAGEREVLATLSAVMRGEMADYVVRKGSGGEEVMQVPVKLADRMHAA